MKLIIYFFCFSLGFTSGFFYFYHLLQSIKKSVREKKNKLSFWQRFLFLSMVSTVVAYLFKEGIVFFLIGFYFARLIYSKKLLDYN